MMKMCKWMLVAIEWSPRTLYQGASSGCHHPLEYGLTNICPQRQNTWEYLGQKRIPNSDVRVDCFIRTNWKGKNQWGSFQTLLSKQNVADNLHWRASFLNKELGQCYAFLQVSKTGFWRCGSGRWNSQNGRFRVQNQTKATNCTSQMKTRFNKTLKRKQVDKLLK